jgi:uncharacterized protein involved in exopolysaccharide biosynthesis
MDDRTPTLEDQWNRTRLVPVRDVLGILSRRRKLVLAVPLVLGLAAFLFFQFVGSYVSESSITPDEDTSGGLTALVGLAAQFGARVPGGLSEAVPIDFYAQLLRSPALLDAVARHEYRFARTPGGPDTLEGTVYELYGVKGDSRSDSTYKLIKRLQRRVAARTDRLAGIVSLRVKAPWPELAQQINRQMLTALNQFSLEQRQSRAGSQRIFVRDRLTEAWSSLIAVEDSLQRFLEANRSFESSPRLRFEAARFQRRIDLFQQVHTSLAQTFEQASIDQVRNTPVITVVQPPELYARRSRKPVTMALAAFVFGVMMSTALALMLEYLAADIRMHPHESGQKGFIARLIQ